MIQLHTREKKNEYTTTKKNNNKQMNGNNMNYLVGFLEYLKLITTLESSRRSTRIEYENKKMNTFLECKS